MCISDIDFVLTDEVLQTPPFDPNKFEFKVKLRELEYKRIEERSVYWSEINGVKREMARVIDKLYKYVKGLSLK